MSWTYTNLKSWYWIAKDCFWSYINLTRKYKLLYEHQIVFMICETENLFLTLACSLRGNVINRHEKCFLILIYFFYGRRVSLTKTIICFSCYFISIVEFNFILFPVTRLSSCTYKEYVSILKDAIIMKCCFWSRPW